MGNFDDGTTQVDKAVPDPWIGRRISSEFVIVRRLGQGGMGAVYAAVRDGDNAPIAIKRMELPGAAARARFRREVAALVGLTHDNIVQLVDAGEEDGIPFLAMELVDGVTLKEALQPGRFALPDALHVARGLASALAHAHGQRVLHRDIKPDNIMLTASRVPKLVDFGIAKLVDRPQTMLTKTGQLMGTPGYMAPELLDDVEFTAQSDLYALGVVLFEMLAGPPFRGHSALELLAMHAKLPAPSLASRGVDVPAPVEALVADLLAKSPSDRPQSAQLVLERLGAVDVTRVEKMALRSTTLEAPAEEVTVRTPFARVRR